MISESQIYLLHQKYSHGRYQKQLLDLVWTHSQIVKEISLLISQKLKTDCQIEVDKNLLINGALIHDLGFYQCFDDDFNKIEKYLLHSQFGYDICHQENLPENLARFCLVHNGVGIPPHIPITLEEEIVTYADCFHSKGHPRFNDIEVVKKEIMEYRLDDRVIVDRLKSKFGIPNLSELEKKYKSWHQKKNEFLDDIKKSVL